MPPRNSILARAYFFPFAVAILFSPTAAAQSTDVPPAWAYAIAAPDYKPPVDNGSLRHVPGSPAAWTLTQLRDAFFAPDWHPQEHPPMPEVVARGRKPDVLACGYCHRAEGTGGPENSSLAGLPAAYIIQQMAEFKNGNRKSSLPDHAPAKNMSALSKAVTDAEIVEAAAYFSSIKPRKLITVVETNRVPNNYVAAWVYSPIPEAEKNRETEPLAGRILEMPKSLEQFESRDTHSEFIAYVPVGSVATGRKLAITGANGKTIPCAQCHGKDLRGTGAPPLVGKTPGMNSEKKSGMEYGMENVPGISGRSPSYLMRQLYDMKHGARAGPRANLMKPVLANLSEEDLTALSAYAASLNP